MPCPDYEDALFSINVERLDELSDHENPDIRWRVAANLRCPMKLLEKLALDGNVLVSFAVSQNPNCPEYIKTFIVARNYMSKLWTSLK